MTKLRQAMIDANRCRRKKLVQICQVLGQPADDETAAETSEEKKHDWTCPKCHRGQMVVQAALAPVRLTGG